MKSDEAAAGHADGDADGGKHVAMPLPMSRAAVVDRYFMEHRAKLLDLAAFLDRCDRAPGSVESNINAAQTSNPQSPRSATVGPTTTNPAPENSSSNDLISGDSTSGAEDFRLAALRNAITLLTDDQPQRTRRILELLSDMSASPLDHAHTKGAAGVPSPNPEP